MGRSGSRKCKVCGAFVPRGTEFCGQACRDEWERTHMLRTCRVCGGPYWTKIKNARCPRCAHKGWTVPEDYRPRVRSYPVSGGAPEEAKPERAETKPECAEAKPEFAETKRKKTADGSPAAADFSAFIASQREAKAQGKRLSYGMWRAKQEAQ